MKSVIKVLLLAGLWAAGSALAGARLVEVEVYDRAQARVLRTYQHQGMKYVEGKPGNEYQIVLRNRTGQRVLAVVSVDGVNAVTGETASYGQSGYVLGPWETLRIQGWRKSLQRTAAFYFTELEDSYGARTGRPDNVGVIGVAVFKEKWTPPPAELSRERESGAADSAARAQAPSARLEEQDLGTGHGRVEHSPARHVEFERASASPEQVLAVYYDSHRNLVARGVIREQIPSRNPQPFPVYFVPDPPR